jgi:Flp pilus assembly protein TadG
VSRRLCDQRGSSVVETAFVFPVLLLVLTTCMSLLWYVAARSAVANTARDAARFATIETDVFCDDSPCYPDVATIQAEVDDGGSVFGMSGCKVGMTPTPVAAESAIASTNEKVQLTVTCDLPDVFKTLDFIGLGSISSTTTATKRAE